MRTEVAITMRGCTLARRDGYWVVRTPGNPHYWFGNSLILDSPPGAHDFERWMALFARELGDLESGHRVFQVDTVDGREGDSAPFIAAGFRIDRTHVLTAASVVPPASGNSEIDVRPVRANREWEAVFELEVAIAVHDDGIENTESQREFRRRRVQARRAMQEDGLGHVWGAFLKGQLVGTAGLFHVGEISRFQSVATDRDHRRQGVCRTLIHEVCSRVLGEQPGRRLVMCASEDYHATRIYQSLGFRVAEQLVAYVRRPAGV